MEADTPQTIAMELLRLITSIQSQQSIDFPKHEYDFLIEVSGVPTYVTVSLECSNPFLIELDQHTYNNVIPFNKNSLNSSGRGKK